MSRRRHRTPRARRATRAATARVQTVLEDSQASLLDLVDNVLTKGVVVTGEVVLGLAGIDLIYLRLSAVLSAIDRVAGRRLLR